LTIFGRSMKIGTSMKIGLVTRSAPSSARRPGFLPTVVAALVSLVAVALCISVIVPIGIGSLLAAVTVWFALPGLIAAWLMYGAMPGRNFSAWVVGPIWGYGVSSLVLLALWVAGIRGNVLLAAPIVACAVSAAAGLWLRGVLTPPAFRRADVVAVLLLISLVPAIVGRPFSRVAEPVPQGRAYRAYFTADMIWRMAVVAEVSKGVVPPRNPFLRGEALHYYWLPHLLTAVEYRMVHRSATLEQVLLVNSVVLGLAFVLFLYGFIRHWVDSPAAALAGCLGALVFTSFEGLERILHFWRGGVSPAATFAALKDINIDAVTRWYYESLPVDGLHRLLWYQPHHSTGYALGLSALLVLAQARSAITLRLLAFCGGLLAITLLFSTFAAIMLTMMVALLAAAVLVRAQQWTTLALGAVAGALPLAGAVWVAQSLRYIDSTGPSLARVLVNPMAVTNVAPALVLSFGPMLILGACGAFIAVSRRRVQQFLAVGAIVLVSFAFYFFVDVRDHQYVYVGWRAGHFLFVALGVLTGYALQELWRAGPGTRTIAVVGSLALAVLSIPTFAIDFYNTQDITNYKPEDKYSWTLVQSHDEVAALTWIRTFTPIDAVVQVEPHAREGRRWADVPAFAERRMSAGLPISMVPLAPYEAASGKVQALYQARDAETAFSLAAHLGIDYLIVGPPERKLFPAFESTLRSSPKRFREAFRSGDVSVFMLEGGS
jgi:hypothetical protein